MKANPDKCHLLTSSSDKISILILTLMTYVRQQDRNQMRFKSYPLHGPIKTTYAVKCIFQITIQLLSISLDVS